MFVGRKAELESLDKSYNKGSFQFPEIYGRRRVGKTTMINEFCAGRKSVYFVAVQSAAKENLEILSAQILSALSPDAPGNPFPSSGIETSQCSKMLSTLLSICQLHTVFEIRFQRRPKGQDQQAGRH